MLTLPLSCRTSYFPTNRMIHPEMWCQSCRAGSWRQREASLELLNGQADKLADGEQRCINHMLFEHYRNPHVRSNCHSFIGHCSPSNSQRFPSLIASFAILRGRSLLRLCDSGPENLSAIYHSRIGGSIDGLKSCHLRRARMPDECNP